MRVREARAVAGRWVAGHAAEVPGFAGALLGGSVAWLPEDAELPGTSDVDVMVVTGDPSSAPGRSKRRYGGVLLEVTVVPWRQLASPEQVLASYYLAGVVAVGPVLADPTGRLAGLKAATAPSSQGGPGSSAAAGTPSGGSLTAWPASTRRPRCPPRCWPGCSRPG